VNLGGAKGGSDFDPKSKSDHEIRRFCVSFMRELSKYIGADTDVPAGDVGCTRREVGWMFGAFKAATTRWEGCITNKGDAFGGSLMKLEATGFGLVHVRQAPKRPDLLANSTTTVRVPNDRIRFQWR